MNDDGYHKDGGHRQTYTLHGSTSSLTSTMSITMAEGQQRPSDPEGYCREATTTGVTEALQDGISMETSIHNNEVCEGLLYSW